RRAACEGVGDWGGGGGGNALADEVPAPVEPDRRAQEALRYARDFAIAHQRAGYVEEPGLVVGASCVVLALLSRLVQVERHLTVELGVDRELDRLGPAGEAYHVGVDNVLAVDLLCQPLDVLIAQQGVGNILIGVDEARVVRVWFHQAM